LYCVNGIGTCAVIIFEFNSFPRRDARVLDTTVGDTVNDRDLVDPYEISISQVTMNFFPFCVDYFFPLSPTHLVSDLTIKMCVTCNEIGHHDNTETLLKVALSTYNLAKQLTETA
jgi:hypothetical protein